MAAMFYQSIEADSITTSSMAVVMVVGFGFSILLKDNKSLLFHAITFIGMSSVFTWQAVHPHLYGKQDANDIIVSGVTYGILYIVISYSSLILKIRYDEVFKSLAAKNTELIEQANEIETQNEELVQSQENLYQLNLHLESIVQMRTHEVKKQNEQLVNYAYSNAHHLRGPVARVLGLIQLSKMDTSLDYPFLFKRIEEQTLEIDEVVKSINKELETQSTNS
jgi:signal transduction histidine kinase